MKEGLLIWRKGRTEGIKIRFDGRMEERTEGRKESKEGGYEGSLTEGSKPHK